MRTAGCFWEFELNPWDMAAGNPAGGRKPAALFRHARRTRSTLHGRICWRITGRFTTQIVDAVSAKIFAGRYVHALPQLPGLRCSGESADSLRKAKLRTSFTFKSH